MKIRKQCPSCKMRLSQRFTVYDSSSETICIACSNCGFSVRRKADILNASASKAASLIRIVSSIVVDDWNVADRRIDCQKTELEEYISEVKKTGK